MEWNEETILRLRTLWAEGHSTAEIGRRLGVSKNAIVGKAHRLDLDARPSPIRREPPPAPPTCFRADGTTLPPLASTDEPVISVPTLAPEPEVVTPVPQPPAPVRAVAPAPVPRLAPVPARPYGRVITCCWPIGEPGTRSFHFCDSPSEPGKPYCGEHAKLAYVKVRDRRDDAA
jgi:GcrA cell cycle regulator